MPWSDTMTSFDCTAPVVSSTFRVYVVTIRSKFLLFPVVLSELENQKQFVFLFLTTDNIIEHLVFAQLSTSILFYVPYRVVQSSGPCYKYRRSLMEAYYWAAEMTNHRTSFQNPNPNSPSLTQEP